MPSAHVLKKDIVVDAVYVPFVNCLLLVYALLSIGSFTFFFFSGTRSALID